MILCSILGYLTLHYITLHYIIMWHIHTLFKRLLLRPEPVGRRPLPQTRRFGKGGWVHRFLFSPPHRCSPMFLFAPGSFAPALAGLPNSPSNIYCNFSGLGVRVVWKLFIRIRGICCADCTFWLYSRFQVHLQTSLSQQSTFNMTCHSPQRSSKPSASCSLLLLLLLLLSWLLLLLLLLYY